MKEYQISEDLFRALIAYHLIGVTEYEDFIRFALEDKLDKAARRERYARRSQK